MASGRLADVPTSSLVDPNELTHRRLAAPACRRAGQRARQRKVDNHLRKHAFARSALCLDRRRAIQLEKSLRASGAEGVSAPDGGGVVCYYDPTTGQFLSRDPLNPITRSAYGYTGNSPLNGTDPSGLWSIDLPVPFSLGSLTGPINCIGTDCESIADQNQGAAQAATNAAGGALEINPITGNRWIAPQLDLPGHGVDQSSGWCSAGQAAMAIGGATGGGEEEETPGGFDPMADATPSGRAFSDHYLYRRAVDSNHQVPGGLIDAVIDNVRGSESGNYTVRYDPDNNVTVVEDPSTGEIQSAHYGRP